MRLTIERTLWHSSGIRRGGPDDQPERALDRKPHSTAWIDPDRLRRFARGAEESERTLPLWLRGIGFRQSRSRRARPGVEEPTDGSWPNARRCIARSRPG